MEPSEPLSFRDPGGRVFIEEERVFRELTPEGKRIWDDLNKEGIMSSLTQRGKAVRTWESTPPTPKQNLCLEHERIPFLSHPFEWPFHFLKKAALLHLELMEDLVPQGFILKDATPMNIQFIGTNPLLIDILSIERLKPGDLWAGYSQFLNTMLYPLMLTAIKGVPFQPWLRGQPDGIKPEDFSSFFSWMEIFKPGVLLHLKLRAGFHRKFNRPNSVKRTDIQKMGFPKEAILRNVQHLKSVVESLSTKSQHGSHWLTYSDSNTYSAEAAAQKEKFILDHLSAWRPRLTWDIGCNTGAYLMKAAPSSVYNIGMDDDPGAIDQLAIRCEKESHRNILPLVVDWANPTPGQGWDLREISSLFSRPQPSAILALALVHHLALSRNVPLSLQLRKFSELTPRLIIEFIDREDPMVQELLLNVGTPHEDYNEQEFLSSVERHFAVNSRLKLTNTRTIFALERRP